MRLAHATLARAAEIAPDGTLSAFGLGFDSIAGSSLPIVERFAIVVRIDEFAGSVDLGEAVFSTTIDILDPEGKSLFARPIVSRAVKVHVADSHSKVRKRHVTFVISLSRVDFKIAGEHMVKIDVLETGTASLVATELPLIVEVGNATP